jgi:hypothetical protein
MDGVLHAANQAARDARRRWTWAVEVGIVLFWNFSYEALRSATPTRKIAAFENADAVERLGAALRINWELTLNQLFLDHTWLADFASYWYQLAHETVTVATLIWLWRSHARVYRPLRSTLVGISLISLVAYRFYPLAPPRFALDGAVDTMLAHPVLFAGWDSITGLSNLYAAMPSIHVAWAVWCALAWNVAGSAPWRRWLWAYPAITALAVVGTANHYVLDAVVGAVAIAAGWQASRRIYDQQSFQHFQANGRGNTVLP